MMNLTKTRVLVITNQASWTSPQPMDTVRYVLHDYWLKTGDPRVAHFPLMHAGPGSLLWIIASYVVFATWLGPRWMANRKPMELKTLMAVHNLFNCATSLYFSYQSLGYIPYLFTFSMDYSREAGPELSSFVAVNSWLYLLTKLHDMFDTVFFVLRKKQSQITVLHVYHHAVVPLVVWAGYRIFPFATSNGIFPLLNAPVHVIMYAYYFLAGLGPEYRKYLWWKKYITVIQLVQFVIFTVFSIGFLFVQHQNLPIWYPMIGLIQSPLFFVLFYRFYRNAYRKNELKTK